MLFFCKTLIRPCATPIWPAHNLFISDIHNWYVSIEIVQRFVWSYISSILSLAAHNKELNIPHYRHFCSSGLYNMIWLYEVDNNHFNLPSTIIKLKFTSDTGRGRLFYMYIKRDYIQGYSTALRHALYTYMHIIYVILLCEYYYIVPTNVKQFSTLIKTFFISQNNFAIWEHITVGI